MSLEAADEALVARLRALPPGTTAPLRGPTPDLVELFEAMALSRHLDLAARELQAQGRGYYTIGSAGHEANAAVALASRPTDPALLHYRSGAFYCARAAQAGSTDPVDDVLRGVMGDRGDPSGGRHKVFGHPDLAVIPTTSTIASHLPRAVGLAFGLTRAPRLGVAPPYPQDSVVIASFGDASANHSTALGAFNAIGHTVHQGLPLPLLLVCEDNGLGISVPTPKGWTERSLRALPGVEYVVADSADPAALLSLSRELVGEVRRSRRPAVLHLRTTRIGGHAGSDAEIAYRSPAQVQAGLDADPLLACAEALIEHGLGASHVLHAYTRAQQRVRRTADRLHPAAPLATAAEVTEPISTYATPVALKPAPERDDLFDGRLPEHAGPLTLAQAVNAALVDLLASRPEAVLFGEDVGAKGGVYGVTRGLQRRFGRARVFDTLLDEQTILGLGLGTSLAGLLPVPEIQYLAYLHNAEDQLRGEAATLPFFSGGRFRNPMLVRVQGLAYQKGFGGHFHNDNSVAVLRDIPGLVVAVPSSAAEAPGLVRSLAGIALADGRACVLLEPIARYHDPDAAAPYCPPHAWSRETPALGEVVLHGEGRDVLVVTFGNGVGMARRVVERLGVPATVLDLVWLSPLPVGALRRIATRFPRILVVDETRASGGVSEGVVTALVDGGYAGSVKRVASHDSVVPLGPAADAVLLGEDDIGDALRSW